jgi:hypothetical protein
MGMESTPITKKDDVTVEPKELPSTLMESAQKALSESQIAHLKKIFNKDMPSSTHEYDPKFNTSFKTVYRGCTQSQLLSMLSQGSAGGATADKDTPAPSEKEASLQVGERVDLVHKPEFTTKFRVAEQFATNCGTEDTYIIAVKIDNKYLTKGSITESGWICNESAPLEILAIAKGRRIG